MFAQNLRYLRQKFGMEQLELANMLGRKSSSSVSEWEKGSYTPKIKVLAEIANIFSVDLDDLMNKDLSISNVTALDKITEIFHQLTPTNQEKLYSYGEQLLEEQRNVIELSDHLKEEPTRYLRKRPSAAGSALYVDDDAVDYEVIPSSLVPNGADELVEIMGDSMEPLIKKGDEVYIRHQPTVENGEIAIIRIEGEGVTCKKVYLKNNMVTLKSINGKYEDMILSPNQITVLGKVLL